MQKQEQFRGRNRTKSIFILLPILLLTLNVSAQAQQKTEAASSSIFSSAAFNALLAIAIVLLLVIVGLAEVVKAASKYQSEKEQKEKTNSGKSIFTIILLMSVFSSSLFAQTEAATVIAETQITHWGLDGFTFYSMTGLIALEVLIIGILYSTAMQLLGVKERKRLETAAKRDLKETPFLEKMNASVAIENEEEIMFDHEYDGIRELDNNLPPWWKYGFYLTIIVAFLYLMNFHVLHTGKLQLDEYKDQLKKAKTDLAEFKKNSTNIMDETNASYLTDQGSLEGGKAIYIANCFACHGKSGEGVVGPNLTDDYWLHGGGIKDIFKTIKYGWTEKGMKSWQQDLSATQIHQVASYVKSLRGSNPANPKEKQGILYTEGGQQSDSTKTIVKDSMPNSVK